MIKIEKFEVNPFMENTYILYDDSKEAVILDPGCVTVSEEKKIEDFISDNKLQLKLLLHTHSHVDHMLGNDFIFRKYGLKPCLHEKDLPVLNSTPQYGALFGIQVSPSPDPEVYINEGDVFEFGNSKLDTVFVPGHSPGHVAFINHEQKLIFSGDVLFKSSIGRTDLPMGDHDTLIESIETKLFTLGEDYVVYPGHGPTTTIGFEKKNNPFLQ